MKSKLFIFSLLIAIPSLLLAEDRLVIKNNGGDDVFVVEDTGLLFAGGTDARNNFQMMIAGHTGGDSHAQLVTNLADSRITVMASTADDFGPRLHMVGPQDPSSAKGTALFDYGSKKFDLPDAEFRVRHQLKESTVDMMKIFGREAVVFPTGDVVVGIRTDNPQFPLQVTTGGAYCDGNQWVNKSSREAKKNIAELSSDEAFATLSNIQPVKFNYKADAANETNVGFIAEDVPELVATQDRKGLVSMEMVAVLTKVVQEQQAMITKLNEEVQSLKNQIQVNTGS